MVKKFAAQTTDMKSINNYYIACEELNFTWNEKQIEDAIYYWNKGYHIDYISDRVERNIDEVAILIMDLRRKGKIKERIGGVFGNKEGQNVK